jgi:hypothetical protein
MMRFINTKGEVLEANKVYTFTEAQITLNGVKKYIVEQAKDVKYVTGVVIHSEAGNNLFSCYQSDFVVGNLPNEKVQEIVHALGEKGYYDFSGMEYQKAKEMSKVNIGADFLPFCSDKTFVGMDVLSAVTGSVAMNNGFLAHPVGGTFAGVADDDDGLDEDCEVDGDDDDDDGDDEEDSEC